MAFRKASKKKQKLRLAISGPAGSGKTFTALTFARELAGPSGRIAVVDTERESSELYAGDVADFDVDPLARFSVEDYLRAIADARKAGYEVLIVDSLSHAWAGRGGILEMKDKIAGTDPKKGFTAWAQLTPLHHRLIDALLTYPGHVIATMRSKQAYQIATEIVEGKTKNVVQKLGMEPVQRDDIPYEFTVMFDMDENNVASVMKTRCRALRGKTFPEPGADVIAILREWLESGAPVDPENERPLDRPASAPSSDSSESAASTPTGPTTSTTAAATSSGETKTSTPETSTTTKQETPSTQATPPTTETVERAPKKAAGEHLKAIRQMQEDVAQLSTRELLVEWAKDMRALPAAKRGDKTAAWTAFQTRCAELNLSARELLDEAENGGKAA